MAGEVVSNPQKTETYCFPIFCEISSRVWLRSSIDRPPSITEDRLLTTSYKTVGKSPDAFCWYVGWSCRTKNENFILHDPLASSSSTNGLHLGLSCRGEWAWYTSSQDSSPSNRRLRVLGPSVIKSRVDTSFKLYDLGIWTHTWGKRSRRTGYKSYPFSCLQCCQKRIFVKELEAWRAQHTENQESSNFRRLSCFLSVDNFSNKPTKIAKGALSTFFGGAGYLGSSTSKWSGPGDFGELVGAGVGCIMIEDSELKIYLLFRWVSTWVLREKQDSHWRCYLYVETT